MRLCADCNASYDENEFVACPLCGSKNVKVV